MSINFKDTEAEMDAETVSAAKKLMLLVLFVFGIGVLWGVCAASVVWMLAS